MTSSHATARHDSSGNGDGGGSNPTPGQSLAKGAAGTALLHIERAHTGTQPWQEAHTWIKLATRAPIVAADHAGLYYGAPAISFILHAAQTDETRRYDTATTTIDAHITRLTRRRLAAANARVDRGEAATFAEYDLFYGLTGIGALLLRHTPSAEVLPPLLSYLVRLTLPLPGGQPGWWVSHDPDPILPTPGGHINLGMAHGAAGFLALLSSAARRGVVVDGQLQAIERLCHWLDCWEQDAPTGPSWPQWLTREQLTDDRTARRGPLRPSWCYGTPGIARAQQLAALALGDTARQQHAEHALAACLADPAQLMLITDPGLCHGIAGLYQTAWRAARDAATPAISRQLPTLTEQLNRIAFTTCSATPPSATGFLTGTTGLALAQHTSAHQLPPHSGWDACLLID